MKKRDKIRGSEKIIEFNFHKYHKKGISPLIEYVLLISTGLALGAVLYVFFQSYIFSFLPTEDCEEGTSLYFITAKCGAEKVLGELNYYYLLKDNVSRFNNGNELCNTLGATCEGVYQSVSGTSWFESVYYCNTTITSLHEANLSFDHLAATCNDLQTDWGMYINVKNTGLFDVPSYDIRASFLQDNDLASVDISPYLISSEINHSGGFVNDSILPSQNNSYWFNLSALYFELGEPRLFNVEITPKQEVDIFLADEPELKSCDNFIVKRDLSNCYYYLRI
jgi:hypothetical protein